MLDVKSENSRKEPGECGPKQVDKTDSSFDLQSLLSTAYSLITDEELNNFEHSISDAARVVWCSRRPIWGSDAICWFIQQYINKNYGTGAKSAEESRLWREKGNRWFQTRHYEKALLCYSKSVCFAPYSKNQEDCKSRCVSGGSELATAFGNRSAALYHLDQYELAVQDCDRAIHCSYPCTLMYKVLQRKGQCLLNLNQYSQAAQIFEQALQLLDQASNLTPEKKVPLTLGLKKLHKRCLNSRVCDVPNAISRPSIPERLAAPSIKLASASRSVGLRQSADKGRYLVADLPLHAGELIIKETPYAVVLLPEYHLTHCHYCCQRTFNPLPCPSCTDVLYCSDQCLQSAKEAHHWLECGLGDCLKAVGSSTWLSLRMLLQGHSETVVVSHETVSVDAVNNLTCARILEANDGRKRVDLDEVDALSGEMVGSCECCREGCQTVTKCQPSQDHCGKEKPGLCAVGLQRTEAVRLCDCSEALLRTNPPSLQGGSVREHSDLHEVEAQCVEALKACDCFGKCFQAKPLSSQSDSVTENATHPDPKSRNASLCTCPKEHIDTDCQALRELPIMEHPTCESESKKTETSYPCGCGQDGSYRSDYRAVDNLMPHTEHHPTQELFNMTVTSLLLSKCVQPRLTLTAEWDDYTAETFHLPTDCGRSKTNQESLQSRDGTHGTSGCSKDLSFGTDCGKNTHNLRGKLETNHSLGLSTEEKIAALLLRHLQQLKCNAHAVTAIETEILTLATLSFDEPSTTTTARSSTLERLTSASPRDMKLHGGGGRNTATAVDTTKQVRLAIAVYPTTSLLNHACEPNVIASFDGAVLSIRATKDIHPGEEILHCYGMKLAPMRPHTKHMAKDDRQRALQNEYYFTCTCHACSSVPDDEIKICNWSSAYGCSRCGHVLQIQGEGKNKVGVCTHSKCRHKHSLRKLSKERERAFSLFQLAQQLIDSNKIEESLDCLHECYTIQCNILYKHHKAVAETEDCLAKCYSLIGDFKKAGTYLRLSVATVEKQFGAESIELAHELHKLAQVLFNGGEVQETLGITDRAIKLLTLHYGTNHTDVQELIEMKMCLLSL